MIVSAPSASFEAVHNEGEMGLVGMIEVRIDDNEGATVIGPTSAGIAELGSTGVYVAVLTAPAAEGQFSILFSSDGSFDDEHTSVEDLLVTTGTTSALSPLVPIDGTYAGTGPAMAWTDVHAVAACCGAEGSDNSAYDQVVVEASEVLYALSGRKYPGISERKVRPRDCRCGGYESSCRCGRQSIIRLSGRPVRSIVEVKIDGTVVDPETYKLTREGIMRVRDPLDTTTRLYWPCRQEMDLADTEEGTFSIRYLHGMDPPALGQRAAAELACNLYRACSDPSDCALPAGAVQVVRGNATIKISAFVNWAFDPRRGWETGMALVDAFLNSANPHGHRKRPAVWSPDLPRHPIAEPISGS